MNTSQNFTQKKTTGKRAVAAVGGLAVLSGVGAGFAGGANAATSSSAAQAQLAKIRYCESGNNYQAYNPSGASGAYQMMPTTWRALSAAKGYSTAASAPKAVQDAAALELYNEMGTSPWVASSSCWSKLGAVPTTASTAKATTKAAVTTATTTSASAAQHVSKAHARRAVTRINHSPKVVSIHTPVHKLRAHTGKHRAAVKFAAPHKAVNKLPAAA